MFLNTVERRLGEQAGSGFQRLPSRTCQSSHPPNASPLSHHPQDIDEVGNDGENGVWRLTNEGEVALEP
ncbi:hypothetical protein VNO78_11206 [Psophocarpus tetragonolobus]|uniref:Uncharacterized protein n=1 Tax=Psophocarpus tetragonolobus TaxID=3891 RepID=A0AAN9SM04_PSOTE